MKVRCPSCRLVVTILPHEFPLTCCGVRHRTPDSLILVDATNADVNAAAMRLLSDKETSDLFPDTDPSLLGNRIKSLTDAIGLPECGSCKKRKAWLNKAHQWLRSQLGVAVEEQDTLRTVTVNTPVSEVKRLVRTQPPGGWQAGFIDWPNVRQAFREMLDEHIAAIPPYPGGYSGRGIVVSVNATSGWSSGKNLRHGYFPGAWVLAKELRRLGCTLPITFAYMGPLEWDQYLTRLVEPLGVTCIDLRERERTDPMRILAGWETKVYAMLHAPYAECMFLDADNVPVKDPTYLFDDPRYREHGAIFWPDAPPSERKEWVPPLVWDSVGLTYQHYVDFESGQLVVDIPRCWREMQTTRFLNEHSDYWYAPGHCFGDKTTWFLAWNKLGTAYAIPRKRPGWNGGALLQHDLDRQLLFEHGVRNKPTLDGYPREGCLTHPGEIAGHLAELRALWKGALWHNYSPTGGEWQIAHRLAGRRFIYRRLGIGERAITLGPGALAGGRVTEGAARCEVRWDVLGNQLALCAEDKPTCILTESKDGTWRGAWLEHERCPVELSPITTDGADG